MGGGNHTLEFKLISGDPSAKVEIQQFNKYFYDNIIFMAPTVKSLGQDMQVKTILEFVDFHHNIMVFASNEVRKQIRDLVNEFGVDFEDYGYTMQGGHPPVAATQKAFSTSGLAWSNNMFSPLGRVFSKLERPVLFEDGIGAIVDTQNEYVFPILKSDPSGYSYHPQASEEKQHGFGAGQQLSLVTGYQTHYNQRIVIAGSIKMCGNDAMLANRDPAQGATIESSSNYVLCTEMVEWNLQERGVVRADNVRHNKVGEENQDGKNPENYKRQVDIEYFIDLQEKKNGEWVPYVADDVQFQFTMLDPYYQVALEQPNKASPTYTYKLKTPWRLGIFKFLVDYKRYGLNYIHNSMEVSVIQLRHDEFPRFETAGYPYYLNVFLLMGGTFLFVVHFAFTEFKSDSKQHKQ
uniref:Dolichyl-diphosphooligosaccharide--protein glycosyltransferase 48 kDa subunit n=1 Tax=Strombidium inclinatum TaxID=197538 RepID=A0A7S3IMK6_9SPIT|mmetsp:Transcript_28848/g.43562  ORF Transcript_28848/g.43562 Transcript_28848/m.43562 type:complete len:406 (+) Transcript_28848:191-1408(+)